MASTDLESQFQWVGCSGKFAGCSMCKFRVGERSGWRIRFGTAPHPSDNDRNHRKGFDKGRGRNLVAEESNLENTRILGSRTWS